MTTTIATCSYGDYRPSMGVPIITSIGVPKAYKEGEIAADEFDELKPFGVFRKMDDKPLEERIAAYHGRLDSKKPEILERLRELRRSYPNDCLILLCWCNLRDVGSRACHRRWFAEWAEKLPGSPTIPEFGRTWSSRVQKAPGLF